MNFSAVQLLSMDDTISYKVYVAKAASLFDVGVTAQLVLMDRARDAPPDLVSRIRGTLKGFIHTEWPFLEQGHSSVTPDFERIQLEAMAKVAAMENCKLEERAVGANREGLEFAHVQVSRNLSKDQIIKELWFDVLEKVSNHLEEFNRVSCRKWRVGNLALGVPRGGRQSGRQSKGGFIEAPDEPPGKFMESGLSGAEKISLTADVKLTVRESVC